jgi:hypothetical protein
MFVDIGTDAAPVEHKEDRGGSRESLPPALLEFGLDA